MIGAIDIGGTKIAVAVVDRTGAVLVAEECPTDATLGFDHALQRMAMMLRRCMAHAPESLEGIGIGCTGPVDPLQGTIGDVPFLPDWKGAAITERLAAEFKVMAALENDADAHALGEYDWGTGKGSQRFLMVTVGTGIGGGIILDGALYRGANGVHPEFGHQVIDPGASTCSCGARGCWESLASGPALSACYKARNPGLPWMEGRAICAAAESGDPRAQAAVDTVGEYLGLGLANLVTLFAPDLIALGGGLMQSSHLFRGRIDAALAANCHLIPRGTTRLTYPRLGGKAGLVGAASVWLHRFGGR